MSKSIFKNLSISIVVVALLFGINKLGIYINNYVTRNFEFPVMAVTVAVFLPILFGVLISYSFNIKGKRREKINWSLLIIQGVPAFIIGIPWQIVIFLYMRLMGIDEINLGVLDSPIAQLTMFQENVRSLAAVWLGKVLVDCIWSKDNGISIPAAMDDGKFGV